VLSYAFEASLFQFIAFAFAAITTVGGLLLMARAFDDPGGRGQVVGGQSGMPSPRMVPTRPGSVPPLLKQEKQRPW
jgi:hypothetical protein